MENKHSKYVQNILCPLISLNLSVRSFGKLFDNNEEAFSEFFWILQSENFRLFTLTLFNQLKVGFQ